MVYYVGKGSWEGCFFALHIQDKHGTTLMKTARFDYALNNPNCKVKEVILQDNERLLGVTSAALPEYKTDGYHIDLQFVIGRKP